MLIFGKARRPSAPSANDPAADPRSPEASPAFRLTRPRRPSAACSGKSVDDRTPLRRVVLLGLVVAAAVLVPGCADDSPQTLEADEPDTSDDTSPAPRPPRSSRGSRPNEPPVIEVDCPLGTTPELEDNDAPERANEVAPNLSFCGSLSPGSDVDYSTFETPPGKKLELFQGVIDGAVEFDLIVGGKTLRPSDVSAFEPGRYLVKAYTKDNQPGRYRYRVRFEL